MHILAKVSVTSVQAAVKLILKIINLLESILGDVDFWLSQHGDEK